MTDWQPISTAPRDGSTIRLGWWYENLTKLEFETATGCWKKVFMSLGFWKNERPYTPMYWQPLPEPPKEPTP